MIRSSVVVAIVLCLSTVGCGLPTDPGDELHGLFDEAWEFMMREFPTYATSVGDHRFDDRLASASIEDEARRASFWRDVLARLEAIDRSELGADDRINYDMFERELRDQLASFEFKEYLIPITNDSGFHSEYPFLAGLTPLRTTRDFENYIARGLHQGGPRHRQADRRHAAVPVQEVATATVRGRAGPGAPGSQVHDRTLLPSRAPAPAPTGSTHMPWRADLCGHSRP
jgi:uncharacterized protein (DUF885 family)